MHGARHGNLLIQLELLAKAAADRAGVELVELVLKGSSRRRRLRVDIDRPGPRGVDLEDCKRVSEWLGEAIETDDVLQDAYVLEVSSPGLDRPIRSDDDLRRNTGRRVEIHTVEPWNGASERVGLLVGFDATTVRIEETPPPAAPLEIPRALIGSMRQDVGF